MDVILVDENDNQIGTSEKIKAHKEGKLHRAFSIFIFNSKKELLLQKRADTKYHSAGLWSNTCCSHPMPNEKTEDAIHRRLVEEMGFDCDMKEIFSFKYNVEFDNGLTEHEFDHVFLGKFEAKPIPNPQEVSDWKWISYDDLKKDIDIHPEMYTHWVKLCLDRVIEKV